MTTDRGDAASTPVDSRSGGRGSSENPYEIGMATDDARGTDETAPKPLDTELEDEQVERDS